MSMRCLTSEARGGGMAICAVLGLLTIVGPPPVLAIDVKLSTEDAQKALEAGRAPMERANSPEEIRKVLQQASMVTRVGAHPEKDPCGASAILRTKRYRLEAFGRQEAAESKKRKTDVRMPEEFIKKVVDMPNMEIEVQLCGDDEYFAEGALIELQQGSKKIKPIDIGKAELVACVRVPDPGRPGRRRQEIIHSSTLTPRLLGLADRLCELGVTQVVMEATSDYVRREGA